ncbi:MAG: hypothetical protein M3R36_14985 [Bacteroidota bacterium]|nr:hypothetical protein [Bacteroidota bacterium]
MIDYQAGTGLVVQTGADVCADTVKINGNFSGGGTICGRQAYTLNFTVLIEGFYNSSSNIMVSDTVTVYLRNATVPFGKKDSAKSVLNRSGTGSFIFFNITNGTNYYVVVKHRNSIELEQFCQSLFIGNINI